MVNPIILLVTLLGFAFIYPLFEKIHKNVGKIVAVVCFTSLVVIPVLWLMEILGGDQKYVYEATAGLQSPLSINVAVSLIEVMVLLVVNSLGLLLLLQVLFRPERSWSGKQVILLAVVLLGANGLVMTRDLFNIFVFMEISSISLFGLLSMSSDKRVFEGGFKYMLATGVSSLFFLLGVGLFYMVAGTLNLDFVSIDKLQSAGVIGNLWPIFIITGILIELKPALANGWAMDTYEAADYSIGVIMSGIQATAFLIVFTKLFTIINPAILAPVMVVVGTLTFIISQIQGLTQTSYKKMLAYSSSAQIGLVILVIGIGGNLILALILLLSHAVSKSGLFFVGKYWGESSVTSGRERPLLLVISGIFILALLGLPPFPAFGAKWSILQMLGSSGQLPILALILVGSFIEGLYLFRWLGKKIKHGEDDFTVLEERVPEDNVNNPPKYGDDQVVGNSSQSLLAGYDGSPKISISKGQFHPVQLVMIVVALGVLTSGLLLNNSVGMEWDFLLPFSIILILSLLDLFKVPIKIQVLLSMLFTVYYGWTLYPQLSGLSMVFGFIFIIGIGIQLFGFLNRKGYTPGLMSMVMGLMVSLGSLLICRTNYQFFFAWEIMTITSYVLVSRGYKAGAGAYKYIIFSLGSAYLVLAGLSMLNGVYIGEAIQLEGNSLAKILITLGVMVKVANIGFHIWLPAAYAEAESDVTALFSTVLSKVGIFLLFLGGLFFSEKLFKGVDLIYILGWVGVLSSVAGSMMALFQEDIKYTLAYSSIGQVGYMVLGFAVMSHLGWMSSLYLAITHMMFKGMLFLSVAGVIYRTGTRFMYQTGGLIRKMPFSFLSALFAIIALSGVPPLSGFGAKWLMYSALFEKGWYLQAALAMFASGVAFLYLFRLIHTIFLGQEKPIYRDIKEAPISLLIPQYIFMMMVMGVSMFPNLILKPLQSVIEPYFSTTIEWSGYEVISSLGYWNGNAVMYVTMGVFIVPLLWLMLTNGKITKVKQFNIVYAAERPFKPETTHYAYNFFGHYRKALGFLVEPWARTFWGKTGVVLEHISGGFRRWNGGNAQGYLFQIILYLLFISVIWGGKIG